MAREGLNVAHLMEISSKLAIVSICLLRFCHYSAFANFNVNTEHFTKYKSLLKEIVSVLYYVCCCTVVEICVALVAAA